MLGSTSDAVTPRRPKRTAAAVAAHNASRALEEENLNDDEALGLPEPLSEPSRGRSTRENVSDEMRADFKGVAAVLTRARTESTETANQSDARRTLKSTIAKRLSNHILRASSPIAWPTSKSWVSPAKNGDGCSRCRYRSAAVVS